MVQRHRVDGHAAYHALLDELKDCSGDVFVLFSGAEDPATGQSWCPDCVKAEPVVEEALSKAPDDAVFVHVTVGTRDVWKDPNCLFRTDPQLQLKGIPTMIKLGTAERLEESQLYNAELVEMLFTE